MDARQYYPDRQPGVIAHRPRARQLNSFAGLKFGTITPTDLDGLIDYHNDRFAFFELKYWEAPLVAAQVRAIVRVVDLIEVAEKRAAFFVADHFVTEPEVDVPADRAMIRAIYTRHQWYQPESEETLRAALDRFLGFEAPAASKPRYRLISYQAAVAGGMQP